MAKHIYIAQQAKGLKFRVTVGDKEVAIKFENGQYSTDDDELAAAIDKRVAVPPVSRFARKADRAAALQMAAQHAAMLKRTGAHKGGVTAAAAKEAMNTEMHERDVELRKAGGDKIKEQFDKDENLVLTDEGVTEPSPGLKVGDDPTADLPLGEQAADAELVEEGAMATEVVKTTGLKFGK